MSLIIMLSSCEENHPIEGPYFGNGLHNGWADQHSIVLWTRLTRTPEGNRAGEKFLKVSSDQHQILRRSNNRDSIHNAQIPPGLRLADMEGACPGAAGEVKITYFPEDRAEEKIEIDWIPVDPDRDYTLQWRLENLEPNTQYIVMLEARTSAGVTPSDTLAGAFLTSPTADEEKNISFCVVTCHDYIRRDDAENGHKIYPSMQKLQPDFYVHTGDVEYYDKPDPYAMTVELMRFKWNRLFALPFQRDFFNCTTTYFMKDDHDVLCNDAHPGITYGTVSYEQGLKIFDQEQFPTNEQTYQTVRWGKHLQIWMVEGRNYRSKNTDTDGPGKTIWGQEQKAWLYRTISESDATFKVLFSSTPILGPDRKNKHDNYANEDFSFEGEEIRQFLNQQENLYISVGDRHWQYVTQPQGTNLWEFSAGAGTDSHASGWKQEDVRPEHRFLRVKGGFLYGNVSDVNGVPTISFQHFDVEGNKVHEEVFRKL